MKKIFTLIAVAALAISAQAQTWNFGEAKWHSGFAADGKVIAKDYAETTTIDGLTIAASASKKVSIDSNNKTFDGVKYIGRLKFGGTGNANERNLSFNVTGPCTITVYFAHGSSSGDARTLKLDSGSFGTNAAEKAVEANATETLTYDYTGTATTFYLYSANSGINVYAIIVSGGTDNIATVKAADDSNAPAYNLAGQKVTEGYKGVVIQNGQKRLQK